MKEVTMSYSEYKKLYGEYKTVHGSYNKADKTIIVELPDNVEHTHIERTDSKWLAVKVNPDNIKCWSKTSACIKLPYQSEYRNCEMWVSRKLIKKDNGMYKVTFKEYFSFRIRKKSGDEIEISADDLIDAFKANQEYPEIHIPEKLEPIHCEVLEELKDE